MDTECDCAPGEQRRRRAGEMLEEHLALFTDDFFNALEDHRDAGNYLADRETQKHDAARLARAAVTNLVTELNMLPVGTVPIYFALEQT